MKCSSNIECIFRVGCLVCYKPLCCCLLIQAALDSGACQRIYLTEIFKDFECDAFFPEFDHGLYLPAQWVVYDIVFFVYSVHILLLSKRKGNVCNTAVEKQKYKTSPGCSLVLWIMGVIELRLDLIFVLWGVKFLRLSNWIIMPL